MNLFHRLTNRKKEFERQASAYLIDKKRGELHTMEETFKGLSRENTPERIDLDERGNVKPIEHAGHNQRLIEYAYQEIQDYLRKTYPLLFSVPK